MSGPDELRRLAAEGEALRVAAAAAEEAARRTDAIRERRQVRRLGRPNLLDALADYPRGSGIRLLPWMLCATLAAAVVWGAAEHFGHPRTSVAGLAGTLGIPFLYFPARRLLGMAAFRRERAWLHDLPFPVRGYFGLLCSTPCEERTVTVRFDLVDEGPDEETVRGLAGRSGGAVKVTRRRLGWEVESGIIFSPSGEDTQPDNAPMLAWMRGFVDETLLPLHAVHRVSAVRFRG